VVARVHSSRRVARRKRLRDGLVVAVSVVDPERLQRLDEGTLRFAQWHAVLRAARPRERRLHRCEIELDDLRVLRFLRLVVPEPVLLAIRFDERDPLLVAAGQAQVLERLVVDREEAAGRAVLRRHVSERCAVRECEPCEARPEVLDELSDNTGAPQHLRYGQDEVGRGRAFGQLAAQTEADDLRNEHRDCLAEHRRLGLDSTDAPAEDAEPVDHRRVGVRSDERVGERGAVA
jgi:hypothetical protein